jgi:hypothetical protein
MMLDLIEIALLKFERSQPFEPPDQEVALARVRGNRRELQEGFARRL